MPFKSEAQRRFMWVNHPDIARRWTEKYGSKAIRKKAYTNVMKEIKKNVGNRSN